MKKEKKDISQKKIGEMDDVAFEEYIESAKKGENEPKTNSGKAEPADDAEKVYMSFKTKEDLQEFQDKTIGKRLREIREAGERDSEQREKLSQLLKMRYGIDDKDKAMNMLLSELGEGNNKLETQPDYSKKVEEIQNEWLRQAEALKNIVPDFDLEKAFENPEFYKSVVEEQKSLAEAYPYIKKTAERQPIAEVGNLTNGVSGYITQDVKTMSDKEFEDYIKKIKNS